MFESINTTETTEVKFVRKSFPTPSFDYDSNTGPTYSVVKIDSNIHDISNEDRTFENPRYKTNRTIRLTNNLGAEYKQDDYFVIDGSPYLIKVTKNRPTFNSCIAESIDISSIPNEVSVLLDNLDNPILDENNNPLEG